MRFVMFVHSLVSDWDNDDADFQRGVVSELQARGHEVSVFEPSNGWSRTNLLRAHPTAFEAWYRAFPTLSSTTYETATIDLDAILQDADVVLVHDWNDHGLIRRLGAHRAAGAGFRLLFHDTCHRPASEIETGSGADLRGYDGVLACTDLIRDLYVRRGFPERAWTWHKAADVRVFKPMSGLPRTEDAVWTSDGSDDQITEIRDYVAEPTRIMKLRVAAYGGPLAESAVTTLTAAGVRQVGWVPSFELAEHLVRTACVIDTPSRTRVTALPGLPSTRLLEAMACGTPVISAPWADTDGLVSAGEDHLVARSGEQMRAHLRAVLHDAALARELGARGRAKILAQHTCAHRVSALLSIHAKLV